MTLTVTAPVKPISTIQRRVICAQARRFGLIQPGVEKLGSEELDAIVKTRDPIQLAVPRCQPFTLGLTESGQTGMEVNPQLPFEQLPTQRLSDDQFKELIENGIVLHTFESNQLNLINGKWHLLFLI